MDFTLNKYEQLCVAIKKTSKSYTVKDFLLKKSNKGVILRHDVDRRLGNSLRIAEIEKRHGLKSTYYFRYPRTFDKKIIDKIQSLGHEIGYHYETLDKAKGDYKKAIKIFKKELSKFDDIKTIAMHGNPLKKWSNRDLWKKYDFKKFGLVGEAYLSFNAKRISYFTDTGGAWNNRRFNIKDHFNTAMIRINGTDDLIKKIKSKKLNVVYISTHPERWSGSFIEWFVVLIWQSVKNVVKRFLR